MDRRHFLSCLGVILFLDPERLLWVPQKTIFIPSLKEWNPNLQTLNEITLKYITPGLVDAMFQKDTFLEYLQESQRVFSNDYRKTLRND